MRLLICFFKNKYLVPEKYESNFHQNPEKFTMLRTEWICFGCLQVRTAAVLVGLWHLLVHLLSFLLYVSAFYFTRGYCEAASVYGVGMRSHLDHVSVHSAEYHLPGSSLKVWIFMSLLSFMATALLIGGVSKKASSFILPFLFLQLFDLLFDFTIITVYVMLSSNVNEFFSQLYSPPFHRFLVNFTSYQKTVFASLYIVISFTAKAYLIYVVYLCYRFLLTHRKTKKEQDLLFHTSENLNHSAVRYNRAEDISS